MEEKLLLLGIKVEDLLIKTENETDLLINVVIELCNMVDIM